MIERIKGFPFRPHYKPSNYDYLWLEFVESNKKRMAWKCSSKEELSRVYQPLRRLAVSRVSKKPVAVYVNYNKLCVGLERK